MTKEKLLAAALLIAAAACGIAAVATAAWIVQAGLVAPRAPLSVAGTAVRVAIVAAAVGLLFARRGRLERWALFLSAIAAGSSALCGLGVDRPAVLAVRLLAHLAAYSVWAIIAFRMFRTMRGGVAAPVMGDLNQ